MQRLLTAVLAALIAHAAVADDASPELIATVKKLDATVFDAGYNDCDMEKLAAVVADDLEFYHDQGGPLFGGAAFLDSMRNGICKLDYKARRELVEMQVYPLFHDGELYGAMENGTHRFHAKYAGRAERPTGIAKFSILWLLDNNEWKMARVLSFDHHALDENGAVQDASDAKSGVLYDALAAMDRVLFDVAFVSCDAGKFATLFMDDAEFYHDESGVTSGEAVRTLKDCPGTRGVRRVLVPGSLAVYPVNGYGAIQVGEHWFVEEGADHSTLARFINLWKNEAGEWRLARVLSFDHQSRPKSEGPQG